MTVRIVCIGASYLFVPPVFMDLAMTGKFHGAEFCVVDIDPHRLKVVVDGLNALKDAHDIDLDIVGTLDRRDVLPGASFVITSITVGHFLAWEQELMYCDIYGISHTVGDTIGPAALSRNLRVIPVLLDVARDMEELCPDAWLINFTNPMSAITLAISTRTSIRTVGLCHEFDGLRGHIARAYGVDRSDVDMTAGGVNHLTFVTDLKVKGKECLGTLLDDVGPSERPESIVDDPEDWWLNRTLMPVFGVLPVASDRHTIEFFPYFLGKANDKGKAWGFNPLDIRKRKRNQADREAVLVGWTRGEGIPSMDRLSGEHAHDIMLSIMEDRGDRHMVNILNNGCIEGLPDDALVEIPATVDASGVHGLKVEGIPRHLISHLQRLSTLHHLTVESALEGSREKALHALLLDPLCLDLGTMEHMLDDLLEANREHLPLFFPGSG